MAVTDAVGGPFTPPGFYYKTFIRPRRLWPALRVGAAPRRRSRAAARDAGRADLADRVPPPARRRAGRRRRHRRAQPRRSPRPSSAPTSCSPTTGPSPAGGCCGRAATSRRARSTARAREPGSRCSTSAPALGYFDGLVPVWQGDTLHQVRARQHVFATGAIEQPLVFAGNDLPGRDALRRRAPARRRFTASRPGRGRWSRRPRTAGSGPRSRLQEAGRRGRWPSPTCARRRHDAASALDRRRDRGPPRLDGRRRGTGRAAVTRRRARAGRRRAAGRQRETRMRPARRLAAARRRRPR